MRSAVCLLAVIVSCTPVEDSGQDRNELPVELEPVLKIGGGFDEGPNRSFTGIAAIGVVGDSILVLEGEAKEIRIFNHAGSFLGRIGRAGEGPGEFEWPTAMGLSPEGIAVVDLGHRRQSLFSYRGELIRTENLGSLADQPLAGSAQIRGGGAVVETAISMSSESGAFPERSIIFMKPERSADTLARYSTGYVPYRTAESYGFLTVRAGSEGDWAVAGDSLLVVAAGEPPTVRWWRVNTGGFVLAGELALPIRPQTFTQDDAHELVDRTNEARRSEGGEPLPRSVQLATPRYWGQVKQLVISDSEGVWVQWDQPRSDDDSNWFQIDLGRRRLELVELPSAFRMLAAYGGELYGFERNDYDVPVLTVYRLVENEAASEGASFR